MGYGAHLLTSVLLRPAQNIPLRGLLRPFSSSLAGDGVVSFFDGCGEVSPAYRRHLQWHRPPTVRRWLVPANACSFIGTVAAPLRRCDSKLGSIGVFTFLDVDKPPRGGSRPPFTPFRILVMMWNELADVSLRYLKPNDFIYVLGHLSSYEKADGNEKRIIRHKLIVKDMNYVQQTGQNKPSQNLHIVEKDDVEVCSSGDATQDEYRNRLHLWQVFFANPHEWWDNRHRKLYPGSPDFKHKHTDECLWLSTSDPPWIKRQLERYDSERVGSSQKNLRDAQRHISEFL